MIQKKLGVCQELEILKDRKMQPEIPFPRCTNSPICISTAQTGKGSVLTVFKANSVFLGTWWDW